MPAFDYTQGQAFLRDRFVPFSEANISIASSPVLYGLSIYTVFSVNWNSTDRTLSLFRLRDHYDRLIASANIMDFNSFAAAWPYEKFEATMLDLVRHNNVQEDVLVRVTVFVDALIAGTKMHNLPHMLAAYAYPMGEILPREGVNVCVSSWTRTPDNAIPARAKVNGSYVNASLMKNEALQNGYDDAVLLNSRGEVAEGTVANIFIVRNGVLITPHVASDILEGITRASIITIARELNIPVEERAVSRSELYIAHEAFFSGSSARITPLLSIDKRLVGSGHIGAITKSLLENYDAAQKGSDNGAHKNWRLVL